MKIEHILSNEDKFSNSTFHHYFQYVTLQKHNIVEQAVIPFTKHFNNRKTSVVVGIDDLYKQSFGAKVIPLWVNIMIIYGMVKIKFTIFSSEKRRTLIGFCGIILPPGKMWFQVMHMIKSSLLNPAQNYCSNERLSTIMDKHFIKF